MVELSANRPVPLSASKTLRLGCLAFAAYVGATILVVIVVLLCRPSRDSDFVRFGQTVELADEVGIFVGLLVGIVALYRLAGRVSPSRRDLLGLRPPSLPQALFWTAAFAILYIGYPYLAPGHRGLWNLDRGLVESYTSTPLLPIFWLLMIVIIPAFEELLGRVCSWEAWGHRG